MSVYKIVLTGGPCAGKTKIFDKVKEQLEKDGYYVICVPETASECIKSGIKPKNDRQHTLMFQDLILTIQSTKESNAEKYADFISHDKDIVILYDRAIMDNRAYLSMRDYENLLNHYNYNEIKMMDKYDLVIDLISTATLKKDSYVLDEVRSEDIDKAEKIDELTSGAWLIHRNLRVIKPTEEIDEKVDLVLAEVYSLLNNSWTRGFDYYEIDKEKSSFSKYNEDNSRRMKITNFRLNAGYLGFGYVISKRDYNNNTSFILEKRTPSKDLSSIVFEQSIPISHDQYIQLVNSHGIKESSSMDILSVIDRGEHYRIINDKDNLFLETNNDIIPRNIAVKTKSFAKPKSMLL